MALVLRMNSQNLIFQKTFLFNYIFIYKMERLGNLFEFFVTTGIKTYD